VLFITNVSFDGYLPTYLISNIKLHKVLVMENSSLECRFSKLKSKMVSEKVALAPIVFCYSTVSRETWSTT
jgi:hypothetical protein